MIARLFRTEPRRGLLLAAVAWMTLAAGSWGALSAHALSGSGTASACISYRTKGIPPGTRCMKMPWQLEGAGPAARWVLITGPGQVCATGPSGGALPPSAMVHRTRSAFRIQVFARPAPHGHFETNCGLRFGLAVHLHVPIDGRRIEGGSWPSRLRYGAFRGYVLGLPRLLGLSPMQALHVLWLEGFHASLTGRGREVTSELPGWGLVNQHDHPAPYDGVAKLQAGRRIAIPSRPALKPGSHPGALVVTGANPVALFDARGRLLARFRVPAGQSSRLRLAPGRYLLIADGETWISCGPAAARVTAGKITRVTVPSGCDLPY